MQRILSGLLLCIIAIFLASCSYSDQTGQAAEASKIIFPLYPSPIIYGPLSRNQYAARLAANMDIHQLAAQTLIVSPGFKRSVSSSFAQSLYEIPVGGVIFLGYNIPDKPMELINYTQGLQDAAREAGAPPMFISIDHEGGTVFRLRGLMDNLPNASETKGFSDEQLFKLYMDSLRTVHDFGFNMNFAPILEALTAENQNFLRFRAYSSDPDQVFHRAGTMIRAMQQIGITAVGKHFPGSGDGDPHYVLPDMGGNISSPQDMELIAFQRAIRELSVPAIMTAHVMLPAIDPDLPATISPAVIQGLLRSEMGFEGLVITDDIYMRGMTLSYSPEQTAVLALNAGADMLLAMGGGYARIHKAIIEAVEDGQLSRQRLEEASSRILAEKMRLGIL